MCKSSKEDLRRVVGKAHIIWYHVSQDLFPSNTFSFDTTLLIQRSKSPLSKLCQGWGDGGGMSLAWAEEKTSLLLLGASKNPPIVRETF